MVPTTGNAKPLPAHSNMIDLYTSGWALAVAKDCDKAKTKISISAISMFPPLRQSDADFFALWMAWKNAAARNVRVCFFLPTQQPAHPATLRNSHAGKIAWENKMHVRFVPGPRLLHAKSIVIDSASCWIGSGNMTAAAALNNHEFYVNFNNNDCAARIESYLDSIANAE